MLISLESASEIKFVVQFVESVLLGDSHASIFSRVSQGDKIQNVSLFQGCQNFKFGTNGRCNLLCNLFSDSIFHLGFEKLLKLTLSFSYYFSSSLSCYQSYGLGLITLDFHISFQLFKFLMTSRFIFDNDLNLLFKTSIFHTLMWFFSNFETGFNIQMVFFNNCLSSFIVKLSLSFISS